MRTINIQLPDGLELKDFDVTMTLASKLYEDGKLSAGQAADIVGVSKRTFIELLGKYNVSVFSNSIQDLHNDIKSA